MTLTVIGALHATALLTCAYSVVSSIRQSHLRRSLFYLVNGVLLFAVPLGLTGVLLGSCSVEDILRISEDDVVLTVSRLLELLGMLLLLQGVARAYTLTLRIGMCKSRRRHLWAVLACLSSGLAALVVSFLVEATPLPYRYADASFVSESFILLGGLGALSLSWVISETKEALQQDCCPRAPILYLIGGVTWLVVFVLLRFVAIRVEQFTGLVVVIGLVVFPWHRLVWSGNEPGMPPLGLLGALGIALALQTANWLMGVIVGCILVGDWWHNAYASNHSTTQMSWEIQVEASSWLDRLMFFRGFERVKPGSLNE